LKLIIVEARAQLNFSSSLGLERLFILVTKVNFFPLEEEKKLAATAAPLIVIVVVNIVVHN